MRTETAESESFNKKLLDVVFDYFNLIQKEYAMALDKWSPDPDYVKQVKETYQKIDKEYEEEEQTEPIPEGLTKPVA